MKPVVIGRGVLAWNASERATQRYGTVILMYPKWYPENKTTPEVPAPLDLPPMWKHGKLIAKVLEVRTSTHVGDKKSNLKPTTPNIGEEVELGEGEFIIIERDDSQYVNIGVKSKKRPVKGKKWWMDARNLYRVHEQTVELIFEPTKSK